MVGWHNKMHHQQPPTQDDNGNAMKGTGPGDTDDKCPNTNGRQNQDHENNDTNANCNSTDNGDDKKGTHNHEEGKTATMATVDHEDNHCQEWDNGDNNQKTR